MRARLHRPYRWTLDLYAGPLYLSVTTAPSLHAWTRSRGLHIWPERVEVERAPEHPD